MAVTGGVKFFDKSRALFKDGASATATSNDDSVKNILSVNRFTQWESIASDDTITETIIVTFKSSKTIDRIFLVDMNFKEFTVKYHNGAIFVDFTNVIGVNGALTANIAETIYDKDTAYYEFDSVTTGSIEITCLKTQVVDAQKFLTNFFATVELGTFTGFPRVQPTSTRNETKTKALSRRFVIQKTYETRAIKINFKTHPFQNDLDIAEALFDREEPFLVWPCGGREGTDFFRIEQDVWRLNDVLNMQILGKNKNDYEKGVYVLGFNKSLSMEEHV